MPDDIPTIKATKTILRWAGSKRQLVPAIVGLAPNSYSRYIEPFAGSACVFFTLAPIKAVLGDFNAELIQTYETIKLHPHLVYKQATTWPNTEDEYYRVRAKDCIVNPIERSARFVYLNRYCFNGVYRTNKAGKYNVPRGKNTGDFPSKPDFMKCARALKSSVLRCGDFADCLHDVQKDDFVYLDPPYANDTRETYGEYGYGAFAEKDLDRLISVLENIHRSGARFILSYKAGEKVCKTLRKYRTVEVQVQRHVAGFSKYRKKVSEVLITNS